ncbi:hypothetical protein B0A53_04714 [Rhodotorula sp. CCFEE 5036]|nr:hypothetical protein B0A53_04714 [Rhodotorula sp. CCFEE 5036]
MSAATPFRSLVFRGTVPLQVQLEPQDLPLLADRSVEYYYLQVPRISYLALCLDDIKRNLVQLVLDHAAFAALKDDDLWFETLPENQHHQAEEGIPLRWHWPIGLLYDLHATSRHLGLLPPRPVTIPPSFASVFAPFDEDGSQGQDAGAGGVRSQELPDLLSLSVGGGGATSRRGSNALASSSSSTTLRGGGPLGSGGASSRLRTPSAPPRQQGGTAPSSTSMNRARSAAAAAASASTVPATSSTSSSPSTSISFQPSSSSTVSSPTTGGGVTNEVTMATRPWRIRLRIRNLKGGANGGGGDASSSSRTAAAEAAGVLDGGGGGRNRVEEVRTGFMALVKEADYVRWGSTKRVMNLRKELQDNLWEAVVENDFEKYWNVAAKLVPLPAPPSVGSKKPTRTTPLSSSGEGGRSGSSSSSSQEPDANGVKHVPLRVYLPAPPPSPSGGGGGGGGGGGAVNGAVTVVQEPVAPTRRDGTPTTLRQALSQLVPLLFPPLPSLSTSSSSSSSPAAPPPPPPLAYPLIHGIYPPFETEVGWLGACMAGPDGVVVAKAGRPGATPVDFGIGTSSSSSPSMLPSPRLHRRRSYSTLTSLTSDSPDDERTDAASSSDEPETANARRLLSAPLLDEKGPSLSGEAGKRLWRMQSHGKHRHHHHQHDSDGDDSNGDDDDRHNAKDTLHLSKRTKGFITLGVLVLLCAVGGFVAWKWGTQLYADAKDFLFFPELKTPVDITGVLGSVWGEATERMSADIVGAQRTATSAVVQAAETAAAAVTKAADDAKNKVEDVGKKIGGIFGG